MRAPRGLAVHLALGTGAVLTLIPLAWMVSASFMPTGEANRFPPPLLPSHPTAAHYLLPLAYRIRALFKMDLAQAAYIAELRSGPAGHFAYREAAWQIFEALKERFPAFAASASGGRVSNPREEVDLLKR